MNVASDRILFGDDHPYGQPVDGLERTIDAITLDDVRAFHAAHYRPGNASLVVSGDIDEATLPSQLEAILAAWKAAPPPAAPRPLPWPSPPPPGHRRSPRARPRASCGWSRLAPIAFLRTDPGFRC